MASFANVKYSTVHGATLGAGAAVAALRGVPRVWAGGRGLAVLLVAAMATAAIVVAYQVMDSVGEGHLMVLWIAIWTVAFAALALFAHTVAKVSARVKQRLDAWSAALAQARADERLHEAARRDPRIMAELQRALAREQAASIQVKPAGSAFTASVMCAAANLRQDAIERI